jgi:ribonucleoside-diphosphate reductase alpha chain
MRRLLGTMGIVSDETVQNKIMDYDDFAPDSESMIKDILKNGLANSAFNTVGPTGTISIIGENCTSGIEPLFGVSYEREVRLQAEGSKTEKTRIVHFPLLKHIGPEVLVANDKELCKKYSYITAHDLDYRKRIKLQSAVQKWTDSSVSSTINLNKDATVEDIIDIYMLSHKAELKGVTIFRNGCKKGILSLGENFDSEEGLMVIDIEKYLLKMKDKMLQPHRAYRYVETWKKVKIYISVTVDDQGVPIEVFSNVPYEAGINENGAYSPTLYMERTSYWHSTCRLISLLLRAKIPIDMICNQLKKSAPSMIDLPAVILRVLNKFNRMSDDKIKKIIETKDGGDYCATCGKNGIVYTGGCAVCQLCGDTKCG